MRHEIINNKVIIRIRDRLCESPEELIGSRLFRDTLILAIKRLEKKGSRLLAVFPGGDVDENMTSILIATIGELQRQPRKNVVKVVDGAEVLFRDPELFNDFVEYVYNFWRSFDRFIICYSTGDRLDARPYRTFNKTVQHLTDLVRSVYRDVQENIMGRHPNVYRQVNAGAEVSSIALPLDLPLPNGRYEKLKAIPIIRQVLLVPPLILDPPINTRSGVFEKTDVNPADRIDFVPDDWLCYPARVGDLLILVYVYKEFFDLGFALCNLFELASIEDLARPPDAFYFFGVPGEIGHSFGESPTVFYEDEICGVLVASVPCADRFGYFGYLKKMVLTLHNIIMMRRGRLPYHGAMVRILLKGGIDKTLLLIGDTGAGKSETLEAFRTVGDEYIRDMIIIADDMGSLDIDKDGNVIGYGTEIGAFLRIDDLQPGYAFGQLDRSIIMSPNKTNARIVLPVTTYAEVVRGNRVDIVLYANNYETIDDDHPIVELFNNPGDALRVFREGTVMSKGTTSSTGIVHSYFANIFGPPQYRDLHEGLAQKYFSALFKSGVMVGQMRTRLGVRGCEMTGPQEASKELLALLSE
jgi:hypothetical protein